MATWDKYTNPSLRWRSYSGDVLISGLYGRILDHDVLDVELGESDMGEPQLRSQVAVISLFYSVHLISSLSMGIGKKKRREDKKEATYADL